MYFVPLKIPNKLKTKPITHKQYKRIENMNLIIIPLIGVDYSGNRLGQGGGFYDTSLSFAKFQHKPKKIGVGFDCQLVPLLSHEKHDIKLHYYISENNFIKY